MKATTLYHMEIMLLGQVWFSKCQKHSKCNFRWSGGNAWAPHKALLDCTYGQGDRVMDWSEMAVSQGEGSTIKEGDERRDEAQCCPGEGRRD